MEIIVTQEALRQLNAMNHAKDKDTFIRINGELVGGCGMTVDYALWWDERGVNDLEVVVEKLTFLIDKATIEYIGSEKLTVDYRPQQGFRLVSPHQIVAYGLALKERWG
ncbi:iron-sulfur cluster biosynthesis family protein [Brevibacillus sp. SIMBA_040]|uniref:iron-sulfur cluster biosynthesis family protein n=1 Tax=unclassified Brevibacillus TaxID=2684853 RepID=UPI00397A00F3